jgi:hypothetical protein
MATTGFVGRILQRISSHFDGREHERSARVAIRTAELVISSAADNSVMIESAIRSMLRHSEMIRGTTQRTAVLNALLDAANRTQDAVLRNDITAAIERLSFRSGC